MGRILPAVVALLFLGGAIWPLWSITLSIYEWRRMQTWTTVQAHVVNGGFNRNSGRRTTTYAAYAEYTYRYNGRQYTGTRASISEGADNIGSFQEDLGRHLVKAKGRTIDVYVDPDHPEESIANRDIRWMLVLFKSIFVIAFGGIGVLFSIAVIRAPNKKKGSGRTEVIAAHVK